MERRRLQALRDYNSDVPKRAPYYEDHAKPAWVSAPVMAVAAAAIIIGGHLLSRRAGRRPRDDGGQKKGDVGSTKRSSTRDTTELKRGTQPMSSAELRTLRAEAAEARLQKGDSGCSSSASVASPTPLGSILMLARKVDKLQEESSAYLSSVGTSTALDSTQKKEQLRLLELLTQLQLKIDGVKSDESVRPHRKLQTNRVQSLVLALERIGRSTGADEK